MLERDPTRSDETSRASLPSPLQAVLADLDRRFDENLSALKAALGRLIDPEESFFDFGNTNLRPLSKPLEVLPNASTTERSLARAKQQLEDAMADGRVPRDISVEELSAINLGDLAVSSLLVTGQQHAEARNACQDCIEATRSERCIVLLLADGASKTSEDAPSLSQFGARAQCLLGAKTVLEAMETHRGTIASPQLHSEIYQRLYDGCFGIAKDTGLHPSDAGIFLLTTLQILIITPKETVLLALSDGAVRRPGIGQIEAIIELVKPPYRGGTPPGIINAIELDAYESGEIAERGIQRGQSSQAFYVVGYWPSEEILRSGISMYSDGVWYTAAEPYRQMRTRLGRPPPTRDKQHFPLEELRRNGLNSEGIEVAAALWNLAIPLKGEDKDNRVNKVSKLSLLQELVQRGDSSGIGAEFGVRFATSLAAALSSESPAEQYLAAAQPLVQITYISSPLLCAEEYPNFCSGMQEKLIGDLLPAGARVQETAETLRAYDTKQFWNFVTEDVYFGGYPDRIARWARRVEERFFPDRPLPPDQDPLTPDPLQFIAELTL
ncbi:MAG: hypothetical protein DCC75_00750, partial [Proteobacteria bacterium]